MKDSPLGKMPVRDIKVAHVYDLLQSIAKRKTLSGDERKAGGAPHIAVRLMLTSVRTIEMLLLTQHAVP